MRPTEREPSRDAVLCSTEQAQLGEGIRWDGRRSELLAVDILAGRVYRGRVRDDHSLERVRVYQLPGTVGMIAPLQGDDGWVLGAGRDFVYLAPDGAQRTIARVAPAGTRMNDGACDPQGRFWGGTLADDHHAGGGALYRLDRTGRVEVVLDGLTISNGLGWSPDGLTMYLVDSGPRVVQAFTFDGERGTISAGRILVTVPEDIGAPDGMTVDALGDLWVAIYDGGRVNRYAPDGSLREVYPIPTRQCTCCAFGGPDLRRLFVTTATEGWTDEQRRSDPAGGMVYSIDTDATGRPAAPFCPDRAWWEAFHSNTTANCEPPSSGVTPSR
jgi:sugar lactone lactonase YvrE